MRETERSLDMGEPPKYAETLVIGGGIVGCSVAYHLARGGHDGVLLLEQGQLAGGTSWHAAGLVGRLRASRSMTQMNAYTAELFRQLDMDTESGIGWNPCGSVMLASNPERMLQVQRTAAMAEVFGVEAHILEAEEIARLVPILNTDDLLGGAHLPGDGRVDPQLVTEALAEGARRAGAVIYEGITVHEIEHDGRRATGVKTSAGSIQARRIVLCAGMWSRTLAAHAGISIPLHPVEHHYVESTPVEGVHDALPIVRDPDRSIYLRPNGESLILGAFQGYTKPWMADPIPEDFVFRLLEEDWDHFAEPLASGKHRVPGLAQAAFPRFVNGPESFTPDNNFILGDVPELEDVFVACGFNSAGIACSGGAGKVLAEWIELGEAPCDLWAVDVRRFGPWQNERAFLCARVPEVVGLHYRMAWPNRELETARDHLHSPLHDRLKELGACFGSKMGWERPLFFATDSVDANLDYSFERPDWLDASGAEHRACRERVALFDQSSFSKYLVEGPDALSTLQFLCGGKIDIPIDKTVYTGLFNTRGTFESDLTVVRTGKDRFYVITATGQRFRDQAWIRRNTKDNAEITLRDLTEEVGVLGVMGPRARDLLAPLTSTSLSLEDYPFGMAQEIEIAGVPVRAVRITYVGELGWELHVPFEKMLDLHDTFMSAGAPLGIANAGHNAINSLRLEKGYLAWGTDLSPDDTPLEAGLGFAIDWEKPGGFLGHDALVRQKEAGCERRILLFVLEDPAAIAWGNEPILLDGTIAGYTTSAGYAHTLGGAIAAGYVPLPRGESPRDLLERRWAIRTNGRDVPAKAHLRGPYDPKRTKILC